MHLRATPNGVPSGFHEARRERDAVPALCGEVRCFHQSKEHCGESAKKQDRNEDALPWNTPRETREILRNLFGKNEFSRWFGEKVWRTLWEDATLELKQVCQTQLWLVPACEYVRWDAITRELEMSAHFYFTE